MKKNILFLFAIVLTANLQAQDTYHTYLNDLLTTEYNLPTGEWLFFDNEIAIYQNAGFYGADVMVQDVANQVFSKSDQCIINTAGNNPWDAGWSISNKQAIQAGDKLMAIFYLRSIGGNGEINFFVENNANFDKEVYLSLPLDGEWRRYLVPFESTESYAIDGCSWGFHLANMAQTVEIGGFTALTYADEVALSDLPSEVNNQFYGGYEADAAWRDAAADRIEQHRKADLSISVTKTNGDPVENAAIEIKMLRNEFDFGTAILASRIAGNPDYNATYENKLINLDGQGRGFNTVVFENDLKWDGWEQEWFVTKPELADAVTWLKDRNLKIRGHNLVWPGTDFLPDDIPQNYGNIPYMQNRIDEHLEEIMLSPGIGPEIHDWDVLNEITTNEDLANAFSASPDYETGRELYVEIFEKARELDPEVGLWLNDFMTMSINQTAGGVLYERFKDYTAELVNSSVDIEGLGFQAHIGGFPNSIYDVLETLDDFHSTFGLKAKVTEFDLPSFINEDLAGDYLRDFMTAIYSHESTDGFLFWSFWDGQTFMNAGSNLYREDWSETPAHAAFIDLLFNEWWTEEELATLSDGTANARVFKGLYEVVYECNGEIIRDTVSVVEAMNYEIICDNITTDVEDLVGKAQLKIFPNPSNGLFTIQRSSNELAQVRVFDLAQKMIYQAETSDAQFVLDLQKYRGVCILEIQTEDGVVVEKLIIE